MRNIFEQTRKSIRWSWISVICLLALPLLHSSREAAGGWRGRERSLVDEADGDEAGRDDGRFQEDAVVEPCGRPQGGGELHGRSQGEARDRMRVRREKFRSSNYITKVRDVEAIVLVIDAARTAASGPAATR